MLQVDLEDTSWRDSAECATIAPDMWFPENGRRATAADAKKVCAGCDVREQCLEYAINTPSIQDGIWGGLTPREIRAIRKERNLVGAELDEDTMEDPDGDYGD